MIGVFYTILKCYFLNETSGFNFIHLKSSLSIKSDAKGSSMFFCFFFYYLACMIFSILLHTAKLFQGKILIEDKHTLI